MSVVSDNLTTLRAYPLNMPGSTAMDNVSKLRLLDPATMLTDARRIIINASAIGGNVAQRLASRSLAGATIGLS